jgi:hypothetical protein
VVNRRGLGVHFTLEHFSNFSGIERTGSVYQEALAAATTPSKGVPRRRSRKANIKSRKALVVAILCLLQGLVVVVNEVFDVLGALNFT